MEWAWAAKEELEKSKDCAVFGMKRGKNRVPCPELRKMINAGLGDKVEMLVMDKLRYPLEVTGCSWICKSEGQCWRHKRGSLGHTLACRGTRLILSRNKCVLTGHFADLRLSFPLSEKG